MLSQTSEYALRAIIHLAAQGPDAAATSDTIARHTKVPRGYLSKILRDLVIAGIVHSQRGPTGGFTLARTPDKVSILDVINAVDPLKRITKCPLGNPAHLNLCPLHRRLDDAFAMIEREFKRTSIAETLETNVRAGAACRTLMMPTVRGKP